MEEGKRWILKFCKCAYTIAHNESKITLRNGRARLQLRVQISRFIQFDLDIQMIHTFI